MSRSAVVQPQAVDPRVAGGEMGEPILRVEGLVKHFPIRQGVLFKRQVGAVQAVDGVNFELYPGETLGLVGESGCGKSTTARLILRLEEPTAGKAFYKGTDIFSLPKGELRALRRNIQIIFQDPCVAQSQDDGGDIIREPWEIHKGVLPPLREQARCRSCSGGGAEPGPHEPVPRTSSRGQRQRIRIAAHWL